MQEQDRDKLAAALKFNPDDDAPKLVAKGRGYIAQNIIETAKEHNLSIYKDGDSSLAIAESTDGREHSARTL